MREILIKNTPLLLLSKEIIREKSKHLIVY